MLLAFSPMAARLHAGWRVEWQGLVPAGGETPTATAWQTMTLLASMADALHNLLYLGLKFQRTEPAHCRLADFCYIYGVIHISIYIILQHYGYLSYNELQPTWHRLDMQKFLSVKLLHAKVNSDGEQAGLGKMADDSP